MRLEDLYNQLSNNPNVISEIEKEIELYVHDPSLDNTLLLYTSPIPAMKIYALKIIETRINLKKMNNQNLNLEIEAMKALVKYENSDKFAEVFAKLGIYEWPKMFPDFFQIIIELLSEKNVLGYKILYNFLHLMNYSHEINEMRKSELKKAIGMIYKGYMDLFEDTFAKFIIPILTESLRVLPKNFDYTIIYREGYKYPEETVEFINEMGDSLNLEEVVEMASKMPICLGMLIYFNSIKNKSPKIPNLNKMYEYVYKGLKFNLSTFIISLEFWGKVFCLRNNEMYVDQILTDILSIFINLDAEQKSEVESEVYGFFNILIKNYPTEIFIFVKKNGNLLPKRLGIYFIKKLVEQVNHMQKNNQIIHFNPTELYFEDPILNATLLELLNNPRALEIINMLDLSDKDTSKLVIRIINKFNVSQEMLHEILRRSVFSDKEDANELIVECNVKLGKFEDFSGSWDDDKFLRFFYYLKKVPNEMQVYKNNYFPVFLEKSPFNRCFSILNMLRDIPQEIYVKMYNDIYTYPYEDLGCFNRDLLIYLKIQEPFIKREIERILNDWNTLENTDPLIHCVKSLLAVFQHGIQISNTYKTPFTSIDSLFDLLNIEDAGIIRKISEIFCSYSYQFDVRKATYYFIVNYNSSFVETAHLSIASALTKCIKEDGGAEALHEIIKDLPLENCKNLQAECLKYNTKRGQNLVRNFLKQFKGKPLNLLYVNTFKIGEQNFIDKNKTKKITDFDFEIDKTYFN